MKKMISMMLCLMLILSVFPVTAHAEQIKLSVEFEGAHPAETVEFDSPSYRMHEEAFSEESEAPVMLMSSFEYEEMTSSQKLLDIIKDCEGFSSTPYWDYSQWTIGYGTGCGRTEGEVPAEYWDGISEEKAEELLMEHLSETAEAAVNDFFRQIGRQPKQHQFDAMVDFTYALGTAWVYGSRVADYLRNPTTDLQMVRALGAWCRVDGSVSESTASRRIREALIYCYGMYSLPYGQIESDVPQIDDDDLPMFSYVIYDGNDGHLEVHDDGQIKIKDDDINYFLRSDASQTCRYTEQPVAVRDGYRFAGWTDRNTGKYLLEGHKVNRNVRVRAQWADLDFEDVGPRDWFTPAVAYCQTNKILEGKNDTYFGVREQTSRAMVVTALYRMADSPEVSGDTGLSDIDGESRYYTDAVRWAVKNKIVSGYEDKTFRPGKPVSRSEMVTFLYRFVRNVLGEDVSSPNMISRFSDWNQIPGFAVGPMNWALNRGIVSGKSGSLLAPQDLANRAQLAKVLMGADNLE